MSKKDWSNYCATNENRNQCCQENCIIYPICLIKNLSIENCSCQSEYGYKCDGCVKSENDAGEEK